jgi:hypothetical protein
VNEKLVSIRPGPEFQNDTQLKLTNPNLSRHQNRQQKKCIFEIFWIAAATLLLGEKCRESAEKPLHRTSIVPATTALHFTKLHHRHSLHILKPVKFAVDKYLLGLKCLHNLQMISECENCAFICPSTSTKISMMQKIGFIGLPSNQFGLKPKTPFEAINPLSLEGVDFYCFALLCPQNLEQKLLVKLKLMGSHVGDTFQFATVRGVLTGGLHSAGALTFLKNNKERNLARCPFFTACPALDDDADDDIDEVRIPGPMHTCGKFKTGATLTFDE